MKGTTHPPATAAHTTHHRPPQAPTLTYTDWRSLTCPSLAAWEGIQDWGANEALHKAVRQAKRVWRLRVECSRAGKRLRGQSSSNPAQSPPQPLSQLLPWLLLLFLVTSFQTSMWSSFMWSHLLLVHDLSLNHERCCRLPSLSRCELCINSS